VSYRLDYYGFHKQERDGLAFMANHDHCYFLDLLIDHMLMHRSDVTFVNNCQIDRDRWGDQLYERQECPVYHRSRPDTHLVYHPFDYVTVTNTSNGRFSVLDFKDGPTSAQILQSAPGFAGALITMYEAGWVDEHFTRPELIEPYLFFDQMPNLTEQLMPEIAQIHQTASDNRLFIAATLGDESFYNIQTLDERLVGRRHLARVLAERWPDEVLVWDRADKLPRPDYWRQAAQHRWNLFLPGHPWCYREHEHWRLGLATISLHVWHPLKIALNPGEHYVSVQVPQEEREYTGCSRNPEAHAQAVIETFRRVRDDETLRRRIARSAQQRMELANVRAVAPATIDRLINMTQ
jgi:hypothetical protein